MSTVTITCVGDATFGTKVEEYNFSDGALNRMIEMAKVMYPTINEDGTTEPPGPNAANNRLWGAVVRGVKDNTQNFERAQDIAELPPPEPIP